MNRKSLVHVAIITAVCALGARSAAPFAAIATMPDATSPEFYPDDPLLPDQDASSALLGMFPAMTGSEDELPVRSGSVVSVFQERLAEYTGLRRQIIADLLESGIDRDADHGREFRIRLGRAIRKARRQARPGWIFGAGVAGPMRQLVWDTLRGEDDILSEVPDVPAVRVNDLYPEGEPLATVPSGLLRGLEPLPPELQYRFLGTALILLDIDTAVIVDVIPNAFERSS